MMPADTMFRLVDQRRADLLRDAERQSAFRPHDIVLPPREPWQTRPALSLAALLLAAGTRLQHRYRPALDDCVTC